MRAHRQEVCVYARTQARGASTELAAHTHTHRQEVHPQNMLLDLGKTLDEAGFEGGKAHPNVSFFSLIRMSVFFRLEAPLFE